MGAKPRASRARAALLERRVDLLYLVALVVLAGAFLSPALKDGLGFGGFDLDTTLTSLGDGLYPVIHSHANGDAVSQMVTWNAFDWRMVHSGHFPLWNEYSVLGMPQFLNFESSVLSLPDLVSYLVPLRAAFLVAVGVKLVLAGSGTYVALRVLGLRPLSSFFGGATYLLSGAFANWVTWPLSDVFCWCGYLLAFAVLAYRSSRWRYVMALSLAVMFSVFGGFPEANVLVAIGLGALAIGVVVALALRRARLSLVGALRIALGGVLGVALCAPLWLPGLQVIAVSHRSHDQGPPGLPTRALAMLFAQGYDGLTTGPPVPRYLTSWPYYETVSYVGVIAIMLAVFAVVRRFRRPLVVGLVVALVVSLAATYDPVPFHPFFSIVRHIPALSSIRFARMRTMTAFVVALLSAVGLDELANRATERGARRAYLGAVLSVFGVLAYLFVDSLSSGLVGTLRHQRFASLVWPFALCVLALAVAPLLFGTTRRPLAIGGLVAGQIAFLFFAGVGIASYSPIPFATTPAISRLTAVVGDQLVGLDNGNVGSVRSFGGKDLPRPAGIYPNLNVAYGLHLFGVHDPLTPAAYYATWPVAGAAPVNGGVGLFVPEITSTALARRYGIGYVLVAAGITAPTGTTYVTTIAGERLYRVPSSSRFSFVAATGSVSDLSDNGNGAYAMTIDSPKGGQVALMVTDLPGWRATIDGRPLSLHTYNGVAESVVVPAGSQRLVLRYLPPRLVTGVLLALVALVLLLLGGILSGLAARRRPATSESGASTSADPVGVAS